MALILAIEPDHRQAAQLTHIARHRVHADLVLADTTERALDVIGDRVPDLILVPALLSPSDDAALAAALKVIAAASNVRTLTIPAFASGVKRQESRGGLLGRFRKDKAADVPDGCDPALFAEQISEYLRNVAAEKTLDDYVNEPVAVEEPPAVEPAPPAPPAELFAVADDEIEIDLSDETLSESEDGPESPAEIDDETQVFELSLDDANALMFEETSETPAPEMFAAPEPEPAPVVEAVAEIFGFEDFVEPPPPKLPVHQPIPLSCGLERQWPPMYGALGEFVVALQQIDAAERANQRVAAAASPVQPPAKVPVVPPPAAKSEHPEWAVLVASLRQDIERLRQDHPGSSIGSASADTPTPAPHPQSRPARKTQRPPQDEWGFFDPAQCGFAALLEKLDEITEGGDEADGRRVN